MCSEVCIQFIHSACTHLPIVLEVGQSVSFPVWGIALSSVVSTLIILFLVMTIVVISVAHLRKRNSMMKEITKQR